MSHAGFAPEAEFGAPLAFGLRGLNGLPEREYVKSGCLVGRLLY